ncbi:MAG TPA: glucose 1-dehydrogenase [Sphingobium sp.]|uniref:glucose 1-dehydrogenase n=1 Tax=Sphingobium sp. TaxID=1912891 RepID=UPI002ED365F5
MRYSGKVAIVTGGGAGGMGEAMARGLAAEGLKVIVADISEEKGRATADALTAEGHCAHYLPVDIASPESAEAMATAAADRFGRIDYLVNNAALFGGMERGGLLSMEWDKLKRHFDINLFGGLIVARAVVPHMEKEGGGAIVCTSSTAAWLGAGHYGVAKAGVNALVISLARELGPKGIRINAIAPGMTDTAAFRGQVPPEHLDARLAEISIPRLATPQDQAEAVKFLLSDSASFITGQIVAVDGGSLFGRL